MNRRYHGESARSGRCPLSTLPARTSASPNLSIASILRPPSFSCAAQRARGSHACGRPTPSTSGAGPARRTRSPPAPGPRSPALLGRQSFQREQRRRRLPPRRPLLHPLDVLVAEHQRLEPQAPARPILNPSAADRVHHLVVGDREQPRERRAPLPGCNAAGRTSAAANVSAVRSAASSRSPVRRKKKASTASTRRRRRAQTPPRRACPPRAAPRQHDHHRRPQPVHREGRQLVTAAACPVGSDRARRSAAECVPARLRVTPSSRRESSSGTRPAVAAGL